MLYPHFPHPTACVPVFLKPGVAKILQCDPLKFYHLVIVVKIITQVKQIITISNQMCKA